MKHFDVIVVGGGHAGVEASLASARRGASTALITFRREDIGVMSCNPAIGGIGKGHLVREIDALDGVMGLAADFSGIQFRLLNRSRGPSVQGPRVQADRQRYQEAALSFVSASERVTVIEAEVTELIIERERVRGVVLSDETQIRARAVVMTTGTFLRGEIHIGSECIAAGRRGARSAERLGRFLESISPVMGRLKTGTPARLDGRSINWSAVGRQEGDTSPVMMSFLSGGPKASQIACGVTQTNARTHDIIRQNLHLSAMRSGNITGVGPRYCPSVEDKVTRFADKESHNIFLEPEGLTTNMVYPNGISTSLPRVAQEAFLRSISGLENVDILQYGYAIEYDYVDPKALDRTLQVREIPGLFLAGQINGTTGYEEAAAQGLVAGANAAGRALSLDDFLLDRTNSYIGVMIEDLTQKGVTEPYRMFTSRAEYRLSLRADNADQRLTPLGAAAGLVSDERLTQFEDKLLRVDRLRDFLDCSQATPSELERYGLGIPKDGQRRSRLQILGHVFGETGSAVGIRDILPECKPEDAIQVAIEALYQPYISRQNREVATVRAELDLSIPEGFDFSGIPSLSAELRSKLTSVRPKTMADVRRIEGMTPAALLVLLASVDVSRGTRRASQG